MTTRFLDGPAAGTMLELKRAPLFLRVVIDDEPLFLAEHAARLVKTDPSAGFTEADAQKAIKILNS